MEIEVDLKQEPNIKIWGDIDCSNNKQLMEAFMVALFTEKEKYSVDLTNLSYLDSAGISALIWFANRVAEKGAVAQVFVSPSPILRILDMVDIDQVPGIDLIVNDLDEEDFDRRMDEHSIT